MKKITPLLGLVLGYFCLLSSSSYASEQATPEKYKHITSIPSSHGEVSFDDYKGKVILLDFWASWCGPCRQSFPWMNEMQTRFADQGLVVLAVNLDSNKKDASDFLNDVPANFNIIYDHEGGSAEKMEVMGMPMSYLIDRDGRIRHSLIGFNSKKKVQHESHIRTLLEEAKR